MRGSKCEKTLFEIPDIRLLLLFLFLCKRTFCLASFVHRIYCPRQPTGRNLNSVLKKHYPKVPGILV